MRTYFFLTILVVLCGATLGLEASSQDCGCPAATPTERHVLLICPAGDGPTLAEEGATITLQYNALAPPAYASSPGGCVSGVEWCGAWPVSDSLTGSNYRTTVSGSFAGGGYATEFRWILTVFYLPICWDQSAPITLVSPDINADLNVNLQDFAAFALRYPNAIEPNRPYDPHIDFNGDGILGLVDYALFAQHMNHVCS